MSWFFSESTGGFYNDETHVKIPSDAFEVSNADRQEFLNNQGQRYFENGKLKIREVLEQPRSDQIKSRLGEIDRLTIRALRSIAVGKSDFHDAEILQALENEASDLRKELEGL